MHAWYASGWEFRSCLSWLAIYIAIVCVRTVRTNLKHFGLKCGINSLRSDEVSWKLFPFIGSHSREKEKIQLQRLREHNPDMTFRHDKHDIYPAKLNVCEWGSWLFQSLGVKIVERIGRVRYWKYKYSIAILCVHFCHSNGRVEKKALDRFVYLRRTRWPRRIGVKRIVKYVLMNGRFSGIMKWIGAKKHSLSPTSTHHSPSDIRVINRQCPFFSTRFLQTTT